MRDQKSEQAAECAANRLRTLLRLDPGEEPVGLILGTGWGDALEIGDKHDPIPFTSIPGFDALPTLEGHARRVVSGTLAGRRVIALQGRIHLNERPADPQLYAMVRLQIEMLIKLGVKHFVITCAVGSLRADFEVGDVVLIDGFVDCFVPSRTLKAGEFYSAEDAIDSAWRRAALASDAGLGLTLREGGHVMILGPGFEGRRYTKKFLASTGASVVGMSALPEADVAAAYGDCGVTILPVGFITNTASEEHSHETNVARAKEKKEHLAALLHQIVKCLDH